jgi:hypothetical protein
VTALGRTSRSTRSTRFGRAVALLLAAGDEGVQGIGRALQDWAVADGDLAGHRGIENERPVGPARRDRSQKADGGWGISPSFPPAHATTYGLIRRIFSRLNWPGNQTAIKRKRRTLR